MNILSLEEAAYLAGLIDGEGSVMLTNTAGTFRAPMVTISLNELGVLDWVKECVGGGCVIRKSKRQDHHADQFAYSIKNTRAVRLLEQVTPYMRVPKKLARARIIISDYERLTRKNGNYSASERAAKEAFEQEFFSQQ